MYKIDIKKKCVYFSINKDTLKMTFRQIGLMQEKIYKKLDKILIDNQINVQAKKYQDSVGILPGKEEIDEIKSKFYESFKKKRSNDLLVMNLSKKQLKLLGL
jgi:hypothetical protein